MYFTEFAIISANLALFSRLDIDDAVFVDTANAGFLRYSVYANELLEPDGFDEISAIAEQESGSLILVTCENESVDGGYLNRRVVFAKPTY